MFKVFVEHSGEVMDRIKHLGKKEDIDMQEIFFRFTMDSISDVAYGYSMGCNKQKEVPVMRAFDSIQFIMNERFYTPFWKIRRFFRIQEEAVLVKDVKILNAFANEVISSRRKNNTFEGRSDLLSLFIKYFKDRNEEVSDAYLRDVMMNFMIAGRDTTACLLSWFFYLLTIHPDVEQKVLEEVDNVIATASENSNNKNALYEAIVNAKYLHACLSETLRLYPSVPMDGKFALKDDKLPDGTFVPAGVGIAYHPWSYGRLKRLWGDDAEEFRPDRWLDGNEPNEYLFNAFNAGRRLCLGKGMAYLEAKTVATFLLSTFTFRVVDGHKVEVQTSITLPMKNGLRMTVHPRNKKEDGSK